MSFHNISGSNAAEDSDLQNVVFTEEEFTAELLHFFKTGLRNSLKCRIQDQSELVRRSWNRFQFHVKEEERFEDIYNEVLFSVFEIFPLTSYKLKRKILDNFLLCKVERYCYLRKELTRHLPLSISPFSYVDYYTDPLAEEMISEESFCSPSILLDFRVVERLLRYGFSFRMNPDQTRYCLEAISSCLIVKMFPLVYKDVDWDASRIMSAYQTYQEQRRLYLILILLYVVIRAMKPAFYPKWQNYTRSLKLLFKGSTEPFITAQEIDRFLRVAAVNEIDERVREEFYKKFAKEFPRIKEPCTPRSLKHLSRCSIRECLSMSRTLPHGVWNLDIPMQLKHYLLLQEKFDEFHPQYVSTLSSFSRKRSASDDDCTKRLRRNV